MVIKIRDPDTRKITHLVNGFFSLIWTERYNSYGDFELNVPYSKENLDIFKINAFLQIPTSENLMIVDTVSIKNDNLKITGLSLESLLKRRILESEYVTSSDGEVLSSIMYTIAAKAWQGDSSRSVDYIMNDKSYTPPDDETKLKSITFSRGDNNYESIVSTAAIDELGFKYYFQESDLMFRFLVYKKGLNPNVTFSEKGFTFYDSDYKESTRNFITTAYIAGEGEGTKRKIAVINRTTTMLDQDDQQQKIIKYTGIFRREMWVDARDLQKTSKETNNTYKERLKDRGIEKLADKNKEYNIDGVIFDSGKYVLKRDYDLGDIITLRTKYINAKVRISEVIQSWDSTGYKIYPTFTINEIESPEVGETFNLD